MKKLLIFITLLSFNYINSQELDSGFLDSLPDDIKEDLVDKASNNANAASENYRPSLYSSKLQQEEELIDLKARIEQDLYELEKRLSSDETLKINYELELFGSDFFTTFQTSFMPINEPNPDSSYRLDVGDILNIQLTGQVNSIDDFLINSDGSINIENVGKLVVVGLTLGEASELIKSRVKFSIIGTEAYIGLTQLRDVNVLVTGNAKNPGIYTLAGNSNLLHVLSVAGGINEYGSYRAINLVRDNKIVEVLDLYDLLIEGNYNIKERLRAGDVVFVEPRKSIVTIDGAVKRPAKYEVKDNQNLDTVIKYANGFKQTVDLENIYLQRILDGNQKSIPILNSSQFESIKPIDGDLIYVREYPYRQAKIEGAVIKPGTYTMAQGESLDDLIKKAGGFTENAYPLGAIFENVDAKAINKMAHDVLYQEFLGNIIAFSQQNMKGDNDLSPIINLAQQMKSIEPNGRIVVDMLNEDARKSLAIREGDTLIVPEKNNNIYVYGEVSSEGSVMFVPNEEVSFFINKSGGFKKYADKESIYILHPNGETDRYFTKRNIFENQPKSEIKIYPGSVIFVPRKIDNSANRALAAQAYVSIIGNLGLALASLSSINK